MCYFNVEFPLRVYLIFLIACNIRSVYLVYHITINYNTFKRTGGFAHFLRVAAARSLFSVIGREWALPILFLKTAVYPLKSVIIEEENGFVKGVP